MNISIFEKYIQLTHDLHIAYGKKEYVKNIVQFSFTTNT